MSLNKNNNNMGGAYGNSKKEIELIKAKILVLESNQNGIRLELNEVDNYKNIAMTLDTPFRWSISEVETSSNSVEEDEEILFQAERKRRQAIQDEEDRQQLIKIKEKKMKSNIKLLQDEAILVIETQKAEIMKKINALREELIKAETDIETIRRGDRNTELIKERTDVVVITPTISAKLASQPKEKTNGVRVRNTIARPKGGDIMLLFNEPALIKCVMNAKEYFAKVIPAQKLIKCCKADGTFNHTTDKGVKSYLTKTIKLENGKTKDVADETEPAQARTEWTSKDLWIKSCKGEQNLYSSNKDGWKEIYYWNGDPRMAGQADIKDQRWVHMTGVAYDGVKLN